MSPQRVSEKLRFGRFLDSGGTRISENPAFQKLTESKFNGKNGYWRRAEEGNGNEWACFDGSRHRSWVYRARSGAALRHHSSGSQDDRAMAETGHRGNAGSIGGRERTRVHGSS
jgi:hypothetical protein